MTRAMAFLALSISLAACKGGDPEADAILEVKDVIDGKLDSLATDSAALCAALPAPDADGWNATDDAAAVNEARTKWADVRDHYEQVEGAIAVLFPDLDYATDARYDDFISEEGPDANLFDGEGVTGVHAIERILWADAIPENVVAFESTFDGYSAAAFPQTEAEATAMRDELCGRLVTDTTTMHDDFEPLALDAAAAFRGVQGSMAEQFEKVDLAATGEDESRYSQRTLADMRSNLAGGRLVYEAFIPWIDTVEDGAELNTEIAAGFDRVEAHYDSLSGDAIPTVPATWDPEAPSEADLATPYGELWSLLITEADPTVEGSLVHEMDHAAEALEIPQI